MDKTRYLLFALLGMLLAASVFAAPPRAVTVEEEPQATNFGVLLGGSTEDDDPPEESEGAELLEGIVMREDALEGVFLLIKIEDDFRVIELSTRARSPYVVGLGIDDEWLVGELDEATQRKYGPIIKIKPKGGVSDAQPLSELFVTAPPAPGIEPDEIDSKLTDEETLAMLLPAVQKIRAAETEEEAIGLLLPAVQKIRESPSIEPDEIDVAEEQAPSIEPDEIDIKAAEDGFFAKVFGFFRRNP